MTSSSRGGLAVSGGLCSHDVQLRSASLGEAVAILGAVLGGVVGLDQLVSLEPLQGRVHLPGVQRPDLAGASLELLSELEAVLRTLAEQGQQRMSDHHAQYTTQ